VDEVATSFRRTHAITLINLQLAYPIIPVKTTCRTTA
jgi:hypothetical protein